LHYNWDTETEGEEESVGQEKLSLNLTGFYQNWCHIVIIYNTVHKLVIIIGHYCYCGHNHYLSLPTAYYTLHTYWFIANKFMFCYEPVVAHASYVGSYNNNDL
jgi:hypothetical protein